MSRRWPPILLVGIAACAWIIPRVPVAQVDPVRDFLAQGSETQTVLIDVDRIGAVIRDSAIEEFQQVTQGIAERHRLTVDRRVNDEIVLFEVPGAGTRRQAAALARALFVAEREYLVAAGLVVRFEGSTSPLIAPDEIVVKYVAGAEEGGIAELHRRAGVEIARQNPFQDREYLVRLSGDIDNIRTDSLEVSNRLNQSQIVEYAHPNFYRVVDQRQVSLNDTFMPSQWHLNNSGQMGGTIDADIDAPEAWGLTLGNRNADIVVAVIDGGFDVTHPDLASNLWKNAGEIAGDGLDNDGNGLIDDIHGWDFATCDGQSMECGDNTLDGTASGEMHGTAVAGSVAAVGNNQLGVSGSCPTCQLMLIRRGGGVFNDGLAFGYARQMGAQIITSSWGYATGTVETANVEDAINAAADSGRGGLGSVVLFAMTDFNDDNCGPKRDISGLPKVIAVSSSTNWDRFDLTGYGDCMDVLSTSTNDIAALGIRGTLQGVTTDVQGAAGYNKGAGNACLSATQPTAPPANALDYTFCFDGTSFATPVAAGVAGLVLSLDQSITRVQVQRLLQDTADKTEDSEAHYDAETGFSNGAVFQVPATHGFGRINAFEAVHVAAPIADGGLGGVDLFLRDNALDWGNTEQPSSVTFEAARGFLGHWQSVDIKIDAPPYQTPPIDADDFASMLDEDPRVGENNRVYVRVRNRGFRDASNVAVKLLWTQFSTALPSFPDGTIWMDFGDTAKSVGEWEQLGVRRQSSVGYSGASVANTVNDHAGIFRFDNFSPTFDPTRPNHFCLFAITTSDEDPVQSTTLIPDEATPADNNVTHRNVRVDPGTIPMSGQDEQGLYIRNPFDHTIATFLQIDAPRRWRVTIEGLERPDQETRLEPNESRFVTIRISARPGSAGEVTVTQYQRVDGRVAAIGGAVFRYTSEAERQASDPHAWLEENYPELITRPE